MIHLVRWSKLESYLSNLLQSVDFLGTGKKITQIRGAADKPQKRAPTVEAAPDKGPMLINAEAASGFVRTLEREADNFHRLLRGSQRIAYQRVLYEDLSSDYKVWWGWSWGLG